MTGGGFITQKLTNMFWHVSFATLSGQGWKIHYQRKGCDGSCWREDDGTTEILQM